MNKNTLVWCKTKAEARKVLSEAKKMGYMGYYMPNLDEYTNRLWGQYKEETVINLNGDRRCLTYCYKEWYERHAEYGKIITAEKFLGTKPILITINGKLTIAEDKNTGEKGIDACSPDDTYDFHTDALIVVARLVAKDGVISGDAETVLRKLFGDDANSDAPAKRVYTDDDRNFTVGDRVVVRDWDDMVKEYSVKDGDISNNGCPTCFTAEMKHLCGRTATITSGGGDYVRVKFDDESGDTNWYYRRWMFNPIDSDKPTTKFKVGDLVTLKNGLEPGKTYGNMTLYHGDMFDSLNGKPEKVIEVWKRSKNSPSYKTESEWYYSEEMLEKWDENAIHEGDKVRVRKGCTKDRYDTYYQWLKDNISDIDFLLGFERSDAISTMDKYTVVKIAPHGHFGDVRLAFIKRTNGFGDTFSYLYDIDSLEKVTE